jgi:hypothetical protein
VSATIRAEAAAPGAWYFIAVSMGSAHRFMKNPPQRPAL